MTDAIAPFLEQVRGWAAGCEDVLAVALVGSWARGAARADSDVDLVLIVENLTPFLTTQDWVRGFGSVREIRVEDWGLVRSLRVFYDGGPEVEFGLTTREWTSTIPVDPGTERVVSDGMVIVFDKEGLLPRLLSATRHPDRL